MSDEQQVLPCVMCNEYNDQMLMLACVHDPCIECAARHFCQSQMHPESQNVGRNMYSCFKCGELTELDSSSVLELRRLFSNQKRKYDYRKGVASGSSNKGLSSGKKHTQIFATPLQKRQTSDRFKPDRQQLVRGQKQKESYYGNYINPSSKTSPSPYNYPVSQPSSLNNNQKKSILPFICPEHSEEQISYYCFTCQKPICPECAIHGNHRDHEVQTTRKAIKSIKQKMVAWNQKISEQYNNQNIKREEFRKIEKQLSQTVKRDRVAVQQHFNKIRNLVNEKEKQFYRVVDNNFEQNMNLIKQHKSTIERNIEKMTGQKKAVENLNKKDDISVLQQYATRQDEINSMLQQMNSRAIQQDDQRKEINFKLMQDEIEQLMGILQAMRLSTSHFSKV